MSSCFLKAIFRCFIISACRSLLIALQSLSNQDIEPYEKNETIYLPNYMIVRSKHWFLSSPWSCLQSERVILRFICRSQVRHGGECQQSTKLAIFLRRRLVKRFAGFSAHRRSPASHHPQIFWFIGLNNICIFLLKKTLIRFGPFGKNARWFVFYCEGDCWSCPSICVGVLNDTCCFLCNHVLTVDGRW